MKFLSIHTNPEQDNIVRRYSAISLFVIVVLVTFPLNLGCGGSEDETSKNQTNRSQQNVSNSPESGPQPDANESDLPGSLGKTNGQSNRKKKNVAGTDDKTSQTIDPFEPFEKLATIEAGYSDGRAIEFAPDGKVFVTGGDTPKVWKLGEEEPIHVFDELYPLSGTVVEAEALAITLDGNTLVMGAGDGTLVFIDLETKEIEKQLEAHPKGVVSLSLSSDGKTLCSSGYGGQIKIWNMESFDQISTSDTGEDRAVIARLTADGKTFVSAGEDALVWDAQTGKQLDDLNLGEARAIHVMSLDVSSDGKYAVTGEATVDFENAALVWSIETRELVATLKHEFGVSAVAFSPNGKLLATASVNAKARIWRIADQQLLQTIEEDEVSSVDQIAWLPNGKTLALVSDGTIRFWGQKGSLQVNSEPSGKERPDEEPAVEISAAPMTAKELATTGQKPAADTAVIKLPEAATFEDLAQIFDLQKMEKMKGAEVQTENPYRLNYNAPGIAQSAKAYHARIFEEAGWELENSVYQSDRPSYVSLPVVKDGYYIDATFQAGNLKRDKGKVFVTIENHGNIDPRDIPRPGDIEYPGGDRSGASYVVRMEPEELGEFYIKTLTEANWKQGDGLEFTQGALKIEVQSTSYDKGRLIVNIYVEVERR